MMKTALLSIATSLVLSGLVHAQPPPAVQAPIGGSAAPRVSTIEIQGASDPSVVRYLTVKVGQPGDAEVIRSSVLLLSALNLFDAITVEQEIAADGTLGLVFKVVETPRLGEMRFVTRSMETGLDVPVGSSLSKALERAAGLRTREPFRDKALVDASARMTEWLRANAYPRATIEIEPVQDAVVSRHRGFIRDLRVRVLMPKQETLVSSRIDGWPNTLPVPKSPARLGEALTVERMEEWKQTLLEPVSYTHLTLPTKRIV